MTNRTEIRNGRVVTPGGVIENGHVVVTGGRIAHVGTAPGRRLERVRTVDADGRIVMPGLIDLHGDDIEGQLSPRSGAHVDVRTALTVADRINLLNGITTKYHAVAFEEAPDDGRSLATAESLAGEIATEGYTLGDNRFHARCELTGASVGAVERVVDDVGVDLLSVMHHAPGSGQYDTDGFERHYVEDRNWPSEAAAAVAAERSALDPTVRADRLARIASLADRAGVPFASHDDESASDVEEMADLGVQLCEYPLGIDAARRASDLGLAAVMGAPNLVRGGSLWGNLDVRTAIERGFVDALCADYHPPSLLAAPFVDTGEPLVTRIDRVTKTPADIVGLDDRGRIEVGARADLVVVDPAPTPTAELVLVEGEEVVRTGRSRAAPVEPIAHVGS